MNEGIAKAAVLVARRPDGHLPLATRDAILRLAVARGGDPKMVVAALDSAVVVQVAYLAGDDAAAVRDVVADLPACVGGPQALARARAGAGAGAVPERRDLVERQDLCRRSADGALDAGDLTRGVLWLAASAAVARALTGEYRADAPAVEIDDPELDPDCWDPSFCGSLAAAGGVPSSPDGNRELRRRYWWWWLREAVPRAAGVTLDPSLVERASSPLPLADRTARERARSRAVDRGTVAGLERRLAHRAAARGWDRDDLVAVACNERLIDPEPSEPEPASTPARSPG